MAELAADIVEESKAVAEPFSERVEAVEDPQTTSQFPHHRLANSWLPLQAADSELEDASRPCWQVRRHLSTLCTSTLPIAMQKARRFRSRDREICNSGYPASSGRKAPDYTVFGLVDVRSNHTMAVSASWQVRQ